MKGSVRKKRKNAWSYRIDLGTVDGKRKQVEKGGFKTEREATKAMQDVLYHLNNTGDYVENKKVSFHTVYEEFIEREGKATRAYATLKRYDSLYRNHIKDEFGPLYVYQISDTMIIDFLNQKRIKYSEEYVKGMYKFFNVILRYAHDHKYTKKNVMDLVPPPPDPRHVGDIVTYNRKELEQMIERIESTRSKIAFQLGLQAGLRESECFALTWSDIDFEKKKIKVCKQLLYQDKQWCFAPLKTVNSYRSVNITAEFAQYLADMKMQHDAERKLYGDGYKRNFVTDRREPIRTKRRRNRQQPLHWSMTPHSKIPQNCPPFWICISLKRICWTTVDASTSGRRSLNTFKRTRILQNGRNFSKTATTIYGWKS